MDIVPCMTINLPVPRFSSTDRIHWSRGYWVYLADSSSHYLLMNVSGKKTVFVSRHQFHDDLNTGRATVQYDYFGAFQSALREPKRKQRPRFGCPDLWALRFAKSVACSRKKCARK